MICCVTCTPEVRYLCQKESYFIFISFNFFSSSIWVGYSCKAGLTGIDISGILHATLDENR